MLCENFKYVIHFGSFTSCDYNVNSFYKLMLVAYLFIRKHVYFAGGTCNYMSLKAFLTPSSNR